MKPLKILDLSTLIPGPFSTFLLQKNLPVEILKFEDINQPDALVNMKPSEKGIGLAYKALNENKEIIKVDFRSDGIAEIRKEAKTADILIHNYKPGKAFKMGIGYEDIHQINPKLIYCSVSGFGSNSSLSKKSAHDLNILALSGYLDQQLKLIGTITLSPLLLADVFTAYSCALKIISALLTEQLGTHLQVSMSESFQDAMVINNHPQISTNQDFYASDFIFSGNLPCYGVYKSMDNGYVAVAALEKPLWTDFCHHIKREDLIEKQYDKSIVLEVKKEMSKYEKYHWLNSELDFCVTPVLSVLQAIENKYV